MSFDVFAGISVRFPSPSAKVPLGNVVYLGQLLPEPGQGLCPNNGFPALVFAGSPLLAASAWENVEQACLAREGRLLQTLPLPYICPSCPEGSKHTHPSKTTAATLHGPCATPFGEYFRQLLSITRFMLFAEMNLQIKPEGEGLLCLPPCLAWLLPAP